MNTTIPKVLVIDEHYETRRMLMNAPELKNKITVMGAISAEDAEEIFARRNPDIILISPHIPGYIMSSQSLIKSIQRKGFSGPIVAIGPVEERIHIEGASGCNDGCDKAHIVNKVLRLIRA